MRKCSAVVCRPAPAWFPAKLLSNVFVSVLLVMVTLLFVFTQRSFSDSIRSIFNRTAAPLRSSPHVLALLRVHGIGSRRSARARLHSSLVLQSKHYRGRTGASAQVDCFLWSDHSQGTLRFGLGK